MYATLCIYHYTIVVLSACITVMALSAFPDFWLHLHQLYQCTLPDLDFLSLSIRQCCQGHISTNHTACTMSASHAHALGPPQGPTYLSLGHTPYILVDNNNDGDAHDAWGFILPRTLHCLLPISDLVLCVGCGIFLAMPHWIQDVRLSLVAAPTWQCLIIYSTLSGPIY